MANRPWTLLALAAMLLTGCVTGAKQMQDGRRAYNEAVRTSADEELLLNIVRLRYLDTVEFLTITSITAQLEFDVEVGVAVGSDRDSTTTLGTGGLGWSSRPTFSFVPQRGAESVQSLIRPIPLTTIADLAAAGYDLEVVFRLLVQRLNDLPNEIYLPGEEFTRLVATMDEMLVKGELVVGHLEKEVPVSDPIAAESVRGEDLIGAATAGYRFRHLPDLTDMVLVEKQRQPFLYIDAESPRFREVTEALRLPVGDGYYRLRAATKVGAEAMPGEIFVDTRSLLDSLLYLVNGVDVPSEHVERGWCPGDWPDVDLGVTDIREFFHVRASTKRPPDHLAVQYRNRWFYLADDDYQSRYVFAAAAEFLRLQFAPDAGQTPVLTLPVGR